MLKRQCLKLSQPITFLKISPQLRMKINYVKDMRSYMIPFLHQNKEVNKYLLRSYSLLILNKGCFFGGPLFLKQGINALSNPLTSTYDPLLMFLGFGICYSGSVMFESLRNLQVIKIINIALVETTSNAYKHMLSLGPEFYFRGSQRHILFNLYKVQCYLSLGKIFTIQSQTAFEQNLRSFTQYFIPIICDVILSVILLLYYSNSLFALSFLVCFSSYSLFTVKYSDWRRAGIKSFKESEKHLDFITSQTFSNYYNVKYFQKEQQQLTKYREGIKQYYMRNYEIHRTVGILNTVQRFIFGSGMTVNMILAAHYVKVGLMTSGDIIMIQTLMMQFLSPLFILGSMYRGFQDNFIDIEQLSNIVRTPPNVIEGSLPVSQICGKIQFKNVSFAYVKNKEPFLKNMCFKVEQNSFVAIMGKSGIGKTTILNLIFRLYDPAEGTVQIDGVDVRSMQFDFRKHVSFVSQEPYLFNGTIMENLKFGNANVQDEEIYALSKELLLHDLIERMPLKYHSNVGQKGSLFSGGEKQRISLLRALVKNSKILLLDQPTSSIDMSMEQTIGKILKQKKCTKVLITHREGLLPYCDQIIRF